MSNVSTASHARAGHGMRREIGLFGGISVLAGIMIGSGIFYIGAIVLERSGMSLGLALAVWVAGGLLTLLSGMCYAELGAMMPRAGGSYVYLREAYGERIAFMSGFSSFLLSASGSIAALAVAFVAAVNSLVPIDPLWQKVLAVGTILALTAVNMRGVRTGAFVQNVFMVLKLLPILLILVCGLVMGNESPDLTAMPASGVDVSGLLGMMAFGVVATLWAYEGWSNLNSMAEEMRNPRRNIPLAIIGAITGVTLLYVLFNYSLFCVVPFETIAAMIGSGDYYLGTEAAQTLFGSTGMIVVGVAMVLAIFNSLNGCILVFPRVYYAMARDGAMFPSMAKLDARGTPVNALLWSAGVAIVLVLFRSLSELTSLVAVAGLIFNALTLHAVIVLRRKYPTMERPYRVWGFPGVIWLVNLASLGLIVNTVFEDPVTAALGCLIPLAGIGVYELLFRRRVEARAARSAAGAED